MAFIVAAAAAPTLLSSRSPSLSGFRLLFSPSNILNASRRSRRSPCRVQGRSCRGGARRGGPYFVLLLFVSQPDALDAWCGVFGLWSLFVMISVWECVMMMVGIVFSCWGYVAWFGVVWCGEWGEGFVNCCWLLLLSFGCGFTINWNLVDIS